MSPLLKSYAQVYESLYSQCGDNQEGTSGLLITWLYFAIARKVLKTIFDKVMSKSIK